MSTVGTNAWSMSGGALRHQDRIRLIAQYVTMRIAALPAGVRTRLGLNGASGPDLDPGRIRLPDSAMAARAMDHARSLSEPWLFNHCLRTYVWGALLARANRITFDEELFLVACALHDLGLTAAHRSADPTCDCFAVEGARAARTFVTRSGWDPERADRMSEAISLHLNVRVGLGHGAEAHLLHEGAAFDVIGARIRELPPLAVSRVLDRYQRLGFRDHMVDAMKEQARVRRRSRTAFLVRLGFLGMIRAAPLE